MLRYPGEATGPSVTIRLFLNYQGVFVEPHKRDVREHFLMRGPQAWSLKSPGLNIAYRSVSRHQIISLQEVRMYLDRPVPGYQDLNYRIVRDTISGSELRPDIHSLSLHLWRLLHSKKLRRVSASPLLPTLSFISTTWSVRYLA